MHKKVSNAPHVSKCLWTVLLIFLFFCKTGTKENELDEMSQKTVTDTVEMTLYFPKIDGSGLMKVQTQVEDLKKSPSSWFRQMVTMLSKSPSSECFAVFPEVMELYSLFSEKDVLYLDFSRNITNSFFPNLELEESAFKALLLSIKANFPFVNQVKFLVEHEDSEMVWGHIYAQQPFDL